MNTIELFTVALLALIATQTSYLVYSGRVKDSRRNNLDIFVDTSVLMDGRIIQIAEAGFVPGRLVIPRSVIGELQLLADTGDSDKRDRARKGLDVLKLLQGMEHIDVTILQDGSRADEGVDERLLTHAKSSGGMLATIDFNLNKVAIVEGIRVLNVNELAKNLRMSYLPGEHVSLELTTTGNDSHQAVGHLGDGTMVVVEHAKKLIGNTVEVEIIRSLQTAAGRMMFARLASSAHTRETKPRVQGRKSTAAKKTSASQSKQDKHTVRQGAKSQPKTQQKQDSAKPSARRKTSTQREASFIRLIDEQSKRP